jgi:hypothetical protein
MFISSAIFYQIPFQEIVMNFMKLEELRQTNLNAFIEEASRYYEMFEESLAAILEDYDLIPKGGAGPPENDAVPMSMTEIAQKVSLPVKVVGRMQDMCIINSPITCSDFDLLKIIKRLWGNHFFLRCQLARLSQKQREDLIKRPELSEKWKRWVYAQFFFKDIKYGHGGRMINPEKRTFIYDLAEEVESIFRVPNCQNNRDEIKSIREKANNDRKKVKQCRATEREVLRSRGLPETELELWQDTFVFDMYS